MAEKLCSVRKVGMGNRELEVKAVNTNWTADKDYDDAFVCGVRGSLPTWTYVGSGNVTEIANFDGTTSEHIRVYKVTNVKSGDQFHNNYKIVVIA